MTDDHPVVEFWYEFASTYSYPGAMRVEARAAARGVTVRWQPFLLGPIFRAQGWDSSPFNLQPVKGAYMWRDMARICDAEGLSFVRPDPFPQNGLQAARLALALPDDGARAAFSRAVYAAEFGAGMDLTDGSALSALLTEQGHDPDQIWAAAQSDAVKSGLRAQTEAAVAHGIFGAPMFRSEDGEIFWGYDRLDQALEWVLTRNR